MNIHNRHENILTRINFSVAFHEQFKNLFGNSPEEINKSSLDFSHNNHEFDANFIGKMILNSRASILKNFANSNTPLANDMKHAKQFIENMKEFFRDNSYSREAFVAHNAEFSEIADYIARKRPQAVTESFNEKITQIL